MATATGLTYLFRYVGQVVGVASSASLLQAVLNTELHKRFTGPGSDKVSSPLPFSINLSIDLALRFQIIDKIRHVSTAIPSLPPLEQSAARQSYLVALRSVFMLNLVVAVLCFLTSLPLKEYKLPGSFEEEEQQRAEREREGRGEGTEEQR